MSKARNNRRRKAKATKRLMTWRLMGYIREMRDYMRRVCEMAGLPDDRMDAHALSLWQLANRRT